MTGAMLASNQTGNSEVVLRGRYGELLTLNELAEVLRYKTSDAVRKSYMRGSLPVDLYRFPRKKGWFAKVAEVAECIDSMEKV